MLFNHFPVHRHLAVSNILQLTINEQVAQTLYHPQLITPALYLRLTPMASWRVLYNQMEEEEGAQAWFIDWSVQQMNAR